MVEIKTEVLLVVIPCSLVIAYVSEEISASIVTGAVLWVVTVVSEEPVTSLLKMRQHVYLKRL